jgi:hypothetical protein
MSVTLIAYPTADYTTDLQAWNAFNDRADADGATSREDACYGCLFSTFATLYDQPELAYVLDTMGEIDIALTYSISDIEDVTKQRGSFSKTIQLPNTPTNRECFGYAYNIQSFVGGFQPNKRIRAAMWEDGVQIFSGVLQLLSMAKIKGQVTYEVGLFTDNVSLFKAIEGNMLVNTAGVTGMNHVPNSGHVSGTWTASGTASSGYVYGLVDSAGFNDVQSLGNFDVPWWRLGPSIYVKKLVDLIFTEAGFRYSSNFFNSATFGKLVIPYANGLMATNLSGSNIFAQATGSVSASLAGPAINFEFSRDNVSPFYDNSGYWVASSSTFVAPAVPTRWNINLSYVVSGVTFGLDGVAGGDFTVFNTATSSTLALVGTVDLTRSSYPLSGNVYFENVTIPANAVVKFRYDEVEGATSITFKSGGTLQMICLENPQSIGTLDIRTALPADVKQSDLLEDLQKMFNLQFMPDPQDPKLLYIEPWVDFYSSGSVDWSQKADENQEQVLTNGDPNAYTNVIFKYKDMGDYLSKTYKQSYPLAREGYGGRIFNTGNFYGKGDKIVETIAGTLIPASFTTDKIVGRTWDLEGTFTSGSIKALQTGYRLAQYNLITPPTEWRYQYGVTGTTGIPLAVPQTRLPFISHIDNPYAPTMDLAFGQPRTVFYNAVNASGSFINYTNNNLYNKYWLNYINETVSSEALQLELTMMINAADVYQLDFRKPIYYGGIRWRLLEVRDYLVGQQKPCRVTLRRILNLAEFAPTVTTPIANDPSARYNGPIDPDPVDPGYEPPINPELPTPG